MTENVAWQTGGLMVKGTAHTVENNLAFERYGEKPGFQTWKCSLCVLRYLREDPRPFNNDTVVIRNAADRANGGRHKKKIYPLAGKVVRDNVVGSVRDEVMDADSLDFRPRASSRYRALGAGPYPYQQDLTHYWIPGRQLYKASTPVPPDASNAVSATARDVLMWLNAYGARAHHVFFGNDAGAVANAARDSPDYRGVVTHDRNVFHLREKLARGTEYFWRVDAEIVDDVIYTGDVWRFRTSDA